MTKRPDTTSESGRSLIAPAAFLFCLLAAQLLRGGLAAEWALAATIASAAILAIMLARREQEPRFSGDPLFAALEILFPFVLIVALASAVMAWVAGPIRGASLDPSATLVEILLLLGLGCAFLLGAGFGDDRAQRQFMIDGVIFGVAALAGWALALMALRGEARLSASYVSPNTAGTVFGAVLVLAMNVLASSLRRFAQPGERLAIMARGLACLVLGAALMSTASRGAFVAATLALIASFAPQFWRRSRGGGMQVSILLVATIGLIVFAFCGGGLIDRLSASDAQIDSRGPIFALNQALFVRSPLTGYGLGAYDVVNKINLNLNNFAELWSIRSAHNVYLQWLVEGGLVAAAAMFATVALILTRALIGALSDVTERGVLWGLVGVDLVFLVHGFGDFALQTPAVALLWSVLLGLQFGIANRSRRRRPHVRRRLQLGGAAIAGGASAAALGALLLGGGFALGPVTLFPLAAGYDRMATRLLQRGQAPATLDRAERLSQKALDLSPYDTSAALRLAYIDAVRNGRLTAKGAEALAMSYARVPIDQAVASWRLRFALDNWQDLDAKTREATRAEFLALVSTRGHRKVLFDALAAVRPGQGRVIATFWAARVQREPI